MEREFKIGEIADIGGRHLVCVESGPVYSCFECELLGTQHCHIVHCMSELRSDGKDVHFEKA